MDHENFNSYKVEANNQSEANDDPSSKNDTPTHQNINDDDLTQIEQKKNKIL